MPSNAVLPALRRLLVVLLALGVPGQSLAGVPEGMEALAKRDYATARAQFEAAQAEPEALFQLGVMAAQGLGEKADDVKAVSLFARAAAGGHQRAEFLYALALEEGKWTGKDTQRALAMLNKQGNAGAIDAQLELGRVLRWGMYDVPKDETAAAYWYRRAMDAGNTDGQLSYASMLMYGVGIERNQPAAAALYKSAADRGSALGTAYYGSALLRGNGVPKDEVEGMKLMRDAAEKGVSSAQMDVGSAYVFGQFGVARDPKEGVRWVDAASRQGYATAMRLYADLFRTGVGVPANRIESYKWYTLSLRADSGAPGTVSRQAADGRAMVAATMSQADIDEATKRADAFRAQRGFKPLPPPPPLARGDRIEIGGRTVKVPLPRGYLNVWEIAERIQQANPNSSTMTVLFSALSREDLDRFKMGVRVADYKFLELVKYAGDDSVTVTAKLFGEVRREYRDLWQKGLASATASGTLAPGASSTVLRDDDRVFATVGIRPPAAGQESGSVVIYGLMNLSERVLVVRVTGQYTTPEQQAAVSTVAREWINLLVDAN